MRRQGQSPCQSYGQGPGLGLVALSPAIGGEAAPEPAGVKGKIDELRGDLKLSERAGRRECPGFFPGTSLPASQRLLWCSSSSPPPLSDPAAAGLLQGPIPAASVVPLQAPLATAGGTLGRDQASGASSINNAAVGGSPQEPVTALSPLPQR